MKVRLLNRAREVLTRSGLIMIAACIGVPVAFGSFPSTDSP